MFFDRNDTVRSDPAAVICTLSYKLASFDSSIRAAVCTQIARYAGITEASMCAQLSKLLLEPLLSIDELSTHGPIIIILDALDECGDPDSRKDLLVLLAQELAKFPPEFQFLVTSRKESDIEAVFTCQPNIVERELDIIQVGDVSVNHHYHADTTRSNIMVNLITDGDESDSHESDKSIIEDSKIYPVHLLSCRFYIW